jgi:chemotaxis protein MotB
MGKAQAKSRRNGRSPGTTGAPAWIVTFADLMAILVVFFVLIISFSIQDERKLQIVAGSLRDAFGINMEHRRTGVIELQGTPIRDFIRRMTTQPQDTDSHVFEERHEERSVQGPEINTHDMEKADIEQPRQHVMAAESLRQAWREMPEIMEISEQIIVEEVPEGINIQIVDRDGRSMFAAGSKHPYERTHVLLANMAAILRELPNRIAITGHTSSDRSEEAPGYSNWELSADRANAVRSILASHGVDNDRFASVSGKADAEPLFPEDSFLTANRRVSILLLAEEPPLPPNHRP